jgi:hypothetical protein
MIRDIQEILSRLASVFGERTLDHDSEGKARGLPPVERFLDLLRGLGRDLVHAARSLAKARSFTLVCGVALGIGMAPAGSCRVFFVDARA